MTFDSDSLYVFCIYVYISNVLKNIFKIKKKLNGELKELNEALHSLMPVKCHFANYQVIFTYQKKFRWY